MSRISNPELSPSLQALFPVKVAAAELCAAADSSWLFPEERLDVANAVSTRVKEFAAGRLCARKALAEFGIEDFPLRVGSQRQPLWPATITGSITHTTGYCAAVVAKLSDCRSLGVDTEIIDGVEQQLWSKICTSNELKQIRSLAVEYRQKAAALTFSAKEAFYKCQYPLTQELLDFADIAIRTNDWLQVSGSFSVEPQVEAKISTLIHARLEGRFRFHQQFVTTAIVV